MIKMNKAKFGWFAHRWLAPAAGVLFFIVGGAKLVSVFGDARILKLPDTVLPLPGQVLMAIAGAAETAIGAACVFGRKLLVTMAKAA